MIYELAKDFPIQTLLVKEGINHSIDPKCIDKEYTVTEAILKKISAQPSPQNLIAEFALPKATQSVSQSPILILDQINDPGNMGTLLRSALAFGFQQVALIDPCCDPFNAKALRAARGSTFHLSIIQSNSHQQLLKHLKEKAFHLYAADTHGAPYQETQWKTPFGLVLGNESHGISQLLYEHCQLISIPMRSQVESLNVAIAGSILMHASMEAKH